MQVASSRICFTLFHSRERVSNGCCGEPSSSSERQVWLLGDPGGVELRKPVVEHGMQTFALPSLRARALCEEKEEHSKISMASTWFRPVILRFHAGAGGVFGVRACSKQPCMKHTQAMPFCMLQAQAQLPTRQGSRASQAEAGKSRQSSTCDALQAACSAEVKKERRIGNLRRVQGRRDGKQG